MNQLTKPKQRKDPFANQRALVRAGATATAPEKKDGNELDATFAILLLNALKGEIGPLLESIKGEPGYTPEKGKDYFTANDIESMITEVAKRIPKPKDGKDAVTDYDAIYKKMQSMIRAIPKPKDGEPGKDAVVDYERIISAVCGRMPKPEIPQVDYERIIADMEKLLMARVAEIQSKRPVTGSTNSIKGLVDVSLEGLEQDARGNYILASTSGSGALSVETPTGTVNGTNDTFTVTAVPAYITADGVQYFEGAGYSRVGMTITMEVPPSSFIRAIS